MHWTHLTVGINLAALLLNVLSLLLLPRTAAGLYVSLRINLLVVPFNVACLGWCLLGRAAPPQCSGWWLAALAVATVVFAGKLALDAVVVAQWRTWKNVPAWGASASSQAAGLTKL